MKAMKSNIKHIEGEGGVNIEKSSEIEKALYENQ